jgi:hypothetical protein
VSDTGVVYHIHKVSTSPMRKNEEGSAVAAFDLIFWALETAAHPSASLEIQVPSRWTPRITLAALRLALKRSRGVIAAHRVENNFEWMPVPFVTVNDTYFLYCLDRIQLFELLHRHGCLLRIDGGVPE